MLTNPKTDENQAVSTPANHSGAILAGIIILVLVIGLSFYIGRRFARFRALRQSPAPAARGYFSRGMMPFRRMGQNFRTGAGGLTGQIQSLNGNQVQIILPNGQSLTVTLNNNTNYSQVGPASQQSLKSGESISVFGRRTGSGSVSAQSVRINSGAP